MPGILDFLTNLFRSKSAGQGGGMGTVKNEQLPQASKSFKIVTTMVNSVTLSSDMSKLYVIDNGRAIEFDLEVKTGVVLGTLDGQITAATALAATPGTGEGGAVNPDAAARSVKSFKVDVSKGQWTTFFIKEKLTLGVIGATDIDFGFTGSAVTAQAATKCNFEFFSLQTNTLNIKKTGNTVEFTLRLTAPATGGVDI